MSSSLLSRRALLKGSAASVAALPFMGVLPAHAQSYPKRLVVFHTPNGTVMNNWWPAMGMGTTGSTILAPLAPFASRLTLVRGVDMKTAEVKPGLPDHGPDNINLLIARQGHGPKGAWLPSGISIDQHIASAVGKTTRMPSLQLGANVAAYAHIISARGNDLPNLPEGNPQNAFKRLFVSAGLTGDPAGPANMLRRRKSVLDLVAKQVKGVTCQLPADERPKLEAHLQGIHELDLSLQRQSTAQPSASCKPPAAASNKDFPERIRSQIDNLVAALACDITRVVTMQCSNGASGVVHSWADPTITGGHHGISHNSSGVNASTMQREQWLTAIEIWYAKQFLYLLERMDAVKEGNGSLLDNSLVIWAHEQQNGYSHSRRDMPWVLAGSCGGAVKLGLTLNMGGRAHNDLLATFATAMGVPTDKFGDPQFAMGPIAGLLV